ncbi:hypothetical protein ACHWQZ_G001281 [Mnemiopsis leidyi]
MINEKGNLTTHTKQCKKLLSGVNLADRQQDQQTSTLNKDTSFSTEIPVLDDYREPEPNAETILCYTDGPKMDDKSARNELHKLGKDNNVLLRWIPAHKGYLGNEKADELAKKGSGDNEVKSVTLPVPRTVWKNALRQRSHRKMRERWNDMPPHFRTVWRETYTKSLSAELSNLGKNKLRAATQYLTGHCDLNKYKAKMQEHF